MINQKYYIYQFINYSLKIRKMHFNQFMVKYNMDEKGFHQFLIIYENKPNERKTENNPDENPN